MVVASFTLTKSAIFCFLIAWTNIEAFVYSSILQKCHQADIIPVDATVFIGESLRLQCQLKANVTGVTSANMRFIIYSHDKNLSWVVPRENVTEVDNRTLYVNIEVTEDYSKKTTVSCKAGDTCLRATYINVERPIQNVTNLTFVYNYDSQTDLSWSLGQIYLEPVFITVHVDWNPNTPPNLEGNNCSAQTMTSCIIYQLSGHDIIFIRITVSISQDKKNKRPRDAFFNLLYATEATSVHQIWVNDYIKTRPPLNLRVVDNNSTCTSLTWDYTTYFTSCECAAVYELIVTSKYNMSVMAIVNGVRPVLQENVTFCSLSPYTTYILSVRVKPADVNPWSELALTDFTTEEDRPLTGPPITDTSYHAGDCTTQEREVILYWNDPPLDTLQGQLAQFEITMGNITLPLRKGSNFFKTSLDCDAEHVVLVYSATKVGNSMSPSEIVIPKKSDELSLVNNLTVKIEGINGSSKADKLANLTVTWNPVHPRGNVSLIFYMCQETNLPYTCFNDFTTKEISVQEAGMVLTDIPSSTSLFGYALRDDNGHKQGIQWINCVYYEQLPPRRPSPVNVVSLEESLSISWTLSRCNRVTKVLILRYHLQLCIEDNVCSEMTVSSAENSFIATDLQGGRSYDVSIQAESPAGKGPFSEPTAGTPKYGPHKALLPQSIIGIVMGSLAGVIIMGFFVCCCFRLCKQSKIRVMSLAESKQIILNNEENKWLKSSKDSGFDVTNSSASSYGVETVETPTSSRSQESLISPEVAGDNTAVNDIHPEISNNKRTIMTHTLKREVSINPSLEASDEQKSNKPACTTEVMNDCQITRLPDIGNAGSSSDNTNPYVKITNTSFALVSDSYSQIAVDEGYNSPDVEINSPTFLKGTLQPQEFMEAKSSRISPQTPNMFMETKSSPISPQPPNMFMETKSSPISPQPPNMFIETKSSPISPQPQNTSMETKLTTPSSAILTGSHIHVYNVNSKSTDILPDTSAANSLNRDKFSTNCSDFDSGENQPKTQKIKSKNGACEETTSISKESTGLSKNLEDQSDGCCHQNVQSQISAGYVTCTVDGEMNFTMADTNTDSNFVNLIDKSSDYKQDNSIDKSSDYKQNNSIDKSSDYKQDNSIDKSSDYKQDFQSSPTNGEIMLQQIAAQDDDDQSHAGAYKSLEFIEESLGNHDESVISTERRNCFNDDYVANADVDVDAHIFQNDDYVANADVDAHIFQNDDYVANADVDSRILQNDDYVANADVDSRILQNDDYVANADVDAHIFQNDDYVANADVDSRNLQNDDYVANADVDSCILQNDDYVRQTTFTENFI